MGLRTTLHWAALAAAVFALAWIVPFLLALALVGAIAGGVLLVLAARRHTGRERTMTLAGGVLALVLVGIYVVLFFSTLPIKFGENPDTGGVNTDPSPTLESLRDFVGPLVPGLTAIAFVVAFWPMWGTRERALGAGGAGLAVLLQLITALANIDADALGTPLQILYVLAYLAAAAAFLLPVVHPDGAPDTWAAAPPPQRT